ncbi:TetR/AcrR family transcriptional regulator [Pseudonocardia sp. RS010]|uniref:TetR/AcrR family transcriptional regulator n=1 Tax=Pseudonocardia sp. RS010 TaxID=3385979 RepID=UPI0039A007BB
MEHDLPEPPWRTPRKQSARRSLSREAIVEAAMGVLGKEGIDGVSMRRVATELATGAASLYAHVANKDELVELLFDEVAAEIPLPEPDPERWREQVTQLWVDTRAVLMRYRDIARAALRSVPPGPNALRVTETTMRLLRLGGIPDDAVAWSADVVGLYVSASAVEGSGRARDEAYGRWDDRSRQLQDYVAALPADRFPTLVALLPRLSSGTDEERFRFGLDLLVGGLTALATGPRGAGP